MSAIKNFLCATGLFTMVAASPAFAGLEGGVPGQGLDLPEATAEEIASACKKIVTGLDRDPGFTVIAKGHPEFPDLKELQIGPRLKAACNIDDETWNKPPSHDWMSAADRPLHKRKELMPFVGQTMVAMIKKSSIDPAYKKLFWDDHVVADDLQKLRKIVNSEISEIDPKTPLPPRQPRRIPHAKDAGVQEATREQTIAVCQRIAAAITPEQPGLTFLFKGFEKVIDYAPGDILKLFERFCGDIVTEAAKKAPPLDAQITKETLTERYEEACDNMIDIMRNPADKDRAGLYSIIDKDDDTRQSFARACKRDAFDQESAPDAPINDLDPQPLQQVKFPGYQR